MPVQVNRPNSEFRDMQESCLAQLIPSESKMLALRRGSKDRFDLFA